jgi:hypothetical protein
MLYCLIFTILFVPYPFLYFIFGIMKMNKVDSNVYSMIVGLTNTRIFPTDKMVLKITDLFYNSINLLYSNDHIIIFSSQYTTSTMSSSHYRNLLYRFSIVQIMNLFILSLKMLNMCSKKCTSIN